MSYYADRVFEVTFSTGTGNLLLSGAPVGYVTWFAAFGVGAARPYAIEQVATASWEIGMGTVVDNGDGTYSLSRSVVKSSNANALVNFASGSKNVRAVLTAADADLFRAAAAIAATAILKDGSVAYTGDQSLGGHELTNVGKLNKVTITTPATGATFAPADNSTLTTVGANAVTVTSTGTTNVTLPAGTRTLVARDSTDTLTNKTLTSPVINTPTVNGSGGALGLPAGPDTLVGRATTDTLTNKTLTSPVINTPTLNGSGGALALPAGPDTLVGRATVDTLTNKSIDASQLTGTVNAGRLPAFSGGDVTSTAGSAVLAIGANKVTLGMQAALAANSLIGNATGSSATPTAVPLTANLKMTGGSLDTVQGIQTTSSPQFSSLGIGGAPTLYALSVTPATDANGISVNRRASGANASSYWGFFVQNPGATDSFILGQSNSNNGGPLGWIAPNDVFWYSPGGSKFGNSHPTLILDANNNVLLGGDSTSTTLKAATADIAALASVDRLNTRHAAAGNRLLALQSERGSAMYLGDDAVDFAASTGIVSVGGSDVLGIKATSLTVGHTGTALATVEGRATSGAQLAASYDATHSLTLSVDSNGDCNMAATRNIGIGITPRARFDIGLNPSLPGNLAISNFAMLGQQFSSGSMIFGYNAKADETSTDQAVVANTNGSVGYSFMRIGFNGIEWHTTTGAVTGGATASSPRAKLTTAGDLCVGSHTTALGRIDSRSTTNAQLVASYDASNSMAQQVSSTGLCTWTGAGTAKGHVFTDGVQAGTGSARAKLGGTLKTNSVNAANSGSGETDLHSYTVLANTLANDGDSLRVTMTWKTANNNNNKTIKVKFGATTVIDSAPAAANTVWATAVLMITRKSATTQVASFIFAPSVSTGWTGPYGAEVDCAETLSGSVTLKATGQGTATNDVTQIQTVVEYLPAN